MTIEEIRAALQERGWTQKELAAMLHVHPVTLGLILTGKNKLTPQLEAHIELLLARQKEQVIVHKVSLPDGVVERGVPGFNNLSEEQRLTTVQAVLQDAVKWLIQEGEKQFSTEELAQIRAFCSTFNGMPTRSYEYCLDDEERLLTASDGGED